MKRWTESAQPSSIDVAPRLVRLTLVRPQASTWNPITVWIKSHSYKDTLDDNEHNCRAVGVRMLNAIAQHKQKNRDGCQRGGDADQNLHYAPRLRLRLEGQKLPPSYPPPDAE
jgi:hypothetical protein